MKKIWYSFYNRDGYVGSEPAFFDILDKDWKSTLEDGFDQIKKELLSLIADEESMQPYFNQEMMTQAASWKTIPLSAWGITFKENIQKVPNTYKYLERIPGIVSASFNKLSPNAAIKPHFGDTNAIYRCHFGLIVPAALPECGFKVKAEERAWEEGEIFAFCDAHQHTAWNNSKEDRYILLFDVIRPEYIKQKKNVCYNVLSSLLLQSLAQKFKWIGKLPIMLQYGLHKALVLAAYIAIPIRNFIKN